MQNLKYFALKITNDKSYHSFTEKSITLSKVSIIKHKTCDELEKNAYRHLLLLSAITAQHSISTARFLILKPNL